MDQIKIGLFISQCRKNKNLTQQDLADLLNVSNRAVSKWETGKNLPETSIMEELCKILDISITELFNGERASSEGLNINNKEENVDINSEIDLEISAADIKKSIDYQWRLVQIKGYLIIWGIISVILLILNIITSLDNPKFILTGLLIELIFILALGIYLGSFSIYSFIQNKYLLKNFNKFKCYKVILDEPSNSRAYRYSIYYSVNLIYDGVSKVVNTNSCFSSTSKNEIFNLKKFHNKKVIGLYDNIKEKIYIIKVLD